MSDDEQAFSYESGVTDSDFVGYGARGLYHGAMAFGSFTSSKEALIAFANQAISLVERIDLNTIEGVQFDLRHEKYDLSEWLLHPFAELVMHLPGTAPSALERKLPSIWFPWFGTYDVDNYSNHVRSHFRSDVIQYVRSNLYPNIDPRLSDNQIEEMIHERRNMYVVEAGDRIVTGDIKHTFDGDVLEHDHDTTKLELFLHIIKTNGDTISIEDPILIYGKWTAVEHNEDKNSIIVSIMERIRAHFKVECFDDVAEIPMDGSISTRAAHLGYNVWQQMIAYNPVNYDEADQEYADQIHSAIADGIALGYLWAKAEAEINLKPLAQVGAKVRKNGREMGLKFGEVRRQKARDGWEKIARTLAKELRAKNPTYSQDALTSRIASICDQQKIDMKGLPMIKKLISSMEKSGELPSRKRL